MIVIRNRCNDYADPNAVLKVKIALVHTIAAMAAAGVTRCQGKLPEHGSWPLSSLRCSA